MLYSVTSLRNYRLAASDGEVGHVRDIYFDSSDWTVRFLIINNGSWLLGKESLIAVKALGPIDVSKETIHVNLTLEKIKTAPDIDSALPVSRQDYNANEQYFDDNRTPVFSVGVTFALLPELINPWASVPPTADAKRADSHLRSVHDVIGHNIHASDDEIGRVGDFLVDDSDWSIRYFVVNTSMWLGKAVVVPTALIREVSWDERSVYLTIPRESVKHAPEYDAGGSQSEALEQRLADYYDLKLEAVSR